MLIVMIRIMDKQHLLDATEIFRKLNVHKKVGGGAEAMKYTPNVLVIIWGNSADKISIRNPFSNLASI